MIGMRATVIPLSNHLESDQSTFPYTRFEETIPPEILKLECRAGNPMTRYGLVAAPQSIAHHAGTVKCGTAFSGVKGGSELDSELHRRKDDELRES